MALLEVGAQAPEFRVQNINGPDITLADLRGRRAVMVLFPTPAVDPGQTAALQAVYEKYRADVEFMVFQRSVPSIQMAKVFLQQMGVTFPVLLDEAGQVYRLYGVQKPPVAYYVDREGAIVHVASAETGLAGTVQDIEEGIKSYLEIQR